MKIPLRLQSLIFTLIASLAFTTWAETPGLTVKTIVMEDLGESIFRGTPIALLTEKLSRYGFTVTETIESNQTPYLLPLEPDCPYIRLEEAETYRRSTITYVKVLTYRSNKSWLPYFESKTEFVCSATVLSEKGFKGDIYCVPENPEGVSYIVPGTNRGKMGITYCRPLPDFYR